MVGVPCEEIPLDGRRKAPKRLDRASLQNKTMSIDHSQIYVASSLRKHNNVCMSIASPIICKIVITMQNNKYL